VAWNKATNELTKPTGTKFVCALQHDDDDDIQGALCEPTNPTVLASIYKFRDLKKAKDATVPSMSSTADKHDMQNASKPG
jgi:hypothetical protein